MDPRAPIRYAIQSSAYVMRMLLEGLSDADLLERPVPTANHTAWQLGHLLRSENSMLEALRPGRMPKLPPGFIEQHSKENAQSSTGFLTKAEYLEIAARQTEVTLAILSELSDEELQKPAPESVRSYAPTVADMMALQGTHPMMHCGQISVVRRKLGKPHVM